MNNNNIFNSGVYTVLVTPFVDDKISYNDINNLVNRQINTGVKGIIILGTTSESPTISVKEKKELVEHIWNNYNNLINIIVGIGGNNTKEVIQFGRFCVNKCHGFMVTVPYYNKPTQEGIFEHFFHISHDNELRKKEIIMYNIPSRCGVNMEPDTIINIYNSCKNVVAIKEASGSLDQIGQIKNGCNINIFSGDDMCVLPIMSLGGIGVISVVSNLIPEYIVNIVNLCNNNNFVKARNMYYKCHDLIKSLFIVSNPIPLKYLLYKNNIISSQNVRLPLTVINNNIIIQKLENINCCDFTVSDNEKNLIL